MGAGSRTDRRASAAPWRGPGCGEACDQGDVAVEVLRGREAPAPAVDAEQGAGVGRRCGTGGTREAVHVQLEASWSPCPDDGGPGRIVHDRNGRCDGDGAATGLVTQVRRGAGRKPENVIGGARAARPVQVLGRCATGSTFDQQSDRVGLVLLPGGEVWIAAGKRLDLGAVVRGNADAWAVARSHRRGASVELPGPYRPARLREPDIALRCARAGVLPQGQDEAGPRVPDPALTRIDGAGLDRPPRRLGPKRRDRHD